LIHFNIDDDCPAIRRADRFKNRLDRQLFDVIRSRGSMNNDSVPRYFDAEPIHPAPRSLLDRALNGLRKMAVVMDFAKSPVECPHEFPSLGSSQKIGRQANDVFHLQATLPSEIERRRKCAIRRIDSDAHVAECNSLLEQLINLS
jgi:hypothetical protein